MKEALFTLSGAERFSPTVEEWLWGEPAELYAIARYWFGQFRAAGEDVTEVLHDGCPTACIGNAAVGYVNLFRSHVNVGFFQGALLADPHRLLQGTGKRMRHVKLFPGQAIDQQALLALIEQSCEVIRGRLA